MTRWTAWAGALVFVVALVVRVPGIQRFLEGSEVDYMLAARRGFLTNYLDVGTRPVAEFVASGLAMAGLGGDDPALDPDLWSKDARAGDIAAYRHYHPPLFIYTLQAAEGLAGYSDAAVRFVPLAFSLLTIVCLYLGCVLLVPERGAPIGLVAAAILSVLSLHVSTSTDIGWHVPYACLATISLFAIGHLVVRRSLRSLAAAAVATTLAFLTLEHAVFLYLTLAVVLVAVDNPWLRVSRSGVSVHRGLFVAAGAILLTMLVVWPAALVKLSVVKNLGVHAYYTRTLELSPRFFDVYLVLFDRYPVMTVLALVTAVVTVVRRAHLPPALMPFAIYVLAVVVLQAGNQNLKPLYFTSLLPGLALLSAVWIVDAASATGVRARLVGKGFAAAVVVAMLFNVQQALWPRERTNPRAALMAQLAQVEGLDGTTVLTWPAGSHVSQMLTFYFPSTRFVRVIDEPAHVREMTDALRKRAFPFVLVEFNDTRDGGEPPALWSNYRQLFGIPGRSDAEGFELWQRRE
jgi:hypothetical protein